MLINQKEVNMLYDEYVARGNYLAHHGVKGQKWGVRKEQYKSDIRSRIKSSRNAKSTLRSEAKRVGEDFKRKQYKNVGIQLGIGTALGIGAVAATSLLAGPAAAITVASLKGVGTAAGLVAAGHGVANSMDMHRRYSIINELARENNLTQREIYRSREE